MKKTFLTLVFCASLAACGPALVTSAPGTPAAPVGGSPAPVEPLVTAPLGNATVIDEKALYAAEAIYNVPAHAYVTANVNGTLPASLKATAKPLLVEAYLWLGKARKAYALGDKTAFEAAVESLKYFATKAKDILPKPTG